MAQAVWVIPPPFPSSPLNKSLGSFLTGLLALLLLPLSLGAASPQRQVLNFNPEWLLALGDQPGAEASEYNDSSFTKVTLPHAWNEDDAFKLAIDHHRTGVAWYRKHFRLPESSPDGKVFIEFEGARQLAEIWVNGKRVGASENGVMAFGFDITRQVKRWPAWNIIAVRTDNRWDTREFLSGQTFQWSDKNFNANYGGLPKNVRLHLTGPLFQTLPLYSSLGYKGVYIWADNFDISGRSADIHVETEVVQSVRKAADFELRVEVRTEGGTLVGSFHSDPTSIPALGSTVVTASSRLLGLDFWSWGHGALYDVTTILLHQGEELDRVTTRTGFRKTEFRNGVLRLNDRVLQVRGYAQRSSNEWPALGLSVTPWLSDYSNALMVESGGNMVRWMHVTPWKQDVESCDRVGLMQMLPAGDSERDPTDRRWLQRLDLMRDAIIYNRNNPSVMVYEAGNNGISEEHMAEMVEIRNRLDPHGGRAMGSRNMLGSKVAEYGGEMLYINKSAGIPYWQTEYSRDEGLRKYWDEFSPPYHKDGDGPLHKGAPAPTYNRNQDSHAIENVVRWYDYWTERPGTGKRVNGGGLNIVFSDTNTHYRGAENYRRSGEVDAMRIPKDGYYAHRVMWNGWVDPEKPDCHILGHWNYAPGTCKDITVVANTEAVELFLNGRSLGLGQRSHHFLFTFPKVTWEAGHLEARGLDAAGGVTVTSTHDTAGKPASLRLSRISSLGELKADGADLALFEIEVVDDEGRRCPTALDLVHFELDGPADWRGGIAQGPENYILSKDLPVECGVNRVLVRSTPSAGTITLNASADGLKPASLSIESIPCPSTDGWSQTLPSSGLKGRSLRGPSPGKATVKPTRVPLEVTRASSEDGDNALESIDDNEATAWIGKGPVHFALAQAHCVSEITMKMGGFRARSYPIRILVDDIEVWKGATPRSLGYITLKLKPTVGKTVTIELLHASEARDAFGAVVELIDQGNATTGEERVGASQLSLIEVELYGPLVP